MWSPRVTKSYSCETSRAVNDHVKGAEWGGGGVMARENPSNIYRDARRGGIRKVGWQREQKAPNN